MGGCHLWHNLGARCLLQVPQPWMQTCDSLVPKLLLLSLLHSSSFWDSGLHTYMQTYNPYHSCLRLPCLHIMHVILLICALNYTRGQIKFSKSETAQHTGCSLSIVIDNRPVRLYLLVLWCHLVETCMPTPFAHLCQIQTTHWQQLLNVWKTLRSDFLKCLKYNFEFCTN